MDVSVPLSYGLRGTALSPPLGPRVSIGTVPWMGIPSVCDPDTPVKYPLRVLQYPLRVLQYPDRVLQYPDRVLQYPDRVLQNPDRVLQNPDRVV